MENKELLQEEESNLLTLTDENGVETTFEYLDCIEYQGKEYLVLIPAEDDADEIVILEIEPVDEPGQLVIMRIEPVDEENENYLAVEDDATLDAVYAIFKERYEDSLTFVD